jgi:hypothetical protein
MVEKELQPIRIPPTTPWRYVSFNRALNLRAPGEDTGDWHFKVMFFCAPDEPKKVATLAGEGTEVDTTPSLGERGVRDMAKELARRRVQPFAGPVYVANHYRAIADLAMPELMKGRVPLRVTSRAINQWLDTEEQVQTLVDDYLVPLGDQLTGAAREAYEAWLPTVSYE